VYLDPDEGQAGLSQNMPACTLFRAGARAPCEPRRAAGVWGAPFETFMRGSAPACARMGTPGGGEEAERSRKSSSIAGECVCVRMERRVCMRLLQLNLSCVCLCVCSHSQPETSPTCLSMCYLGRMHLAVVIPTGTSSLLLVL
jgi:hypothetical protein